MQYLFYFKVSEAFIPPLNQILNICELQNQRYDDHRSYFVCGKTHFVIANALLAGMVLENRFNLIITRDHFVKAVEYFSHVDLWKFAIPVLSNFSNLMIYQSQSK